MAVTGVLACDPLAALAAAIDASPSATSSLKRTLSVLRAHVATKNANGGTTSADALVAETAASLVPVAAALVAAAKTAKTTETIDAVEEIKTEPKSEAPPPPPPSIADADVTLSTSAPVSFGTPRGRFDVKISDDAFALVSTTPKSTTTHLIRKAHVRKLMALEMGDSNETTCVMVAIDPAFAPVHGKQKLTTLLLQVRRVLVVTPVPVRPRSRGERRSLRTFAVVSPRPPLAFNPRPRRLSTPLLTPFNSAPTFVASRGPSTVRPNDKPVGVIHRARGGGGGDGATLSMVDGVDDVLRGSEGPVRACVALMERACGRRAFAPCAPGTKRVFAGVGGKGCVLSYTLVPIRPRRRGERRSLRTFSPGVFLSPPRVPRFQSRRAATPAFQLRF